MFHNSLADKAAAEQIIEDVGLKLGQLSPNAQQNLLLSVARIDRGIAKSLHALMRERGLLRAA